MPPLFHELPRSSSDSDSGCIPASCLQTAIVNRAAGQFAPGTTQASPHHQLPATAHGVPPPRPAHRIICARGRGLCIRCPCRVCLMMMWGAEGWAAAGAGRPPGHSEGPATATRQLPLRAKPSAYVWAGPAARVLAKCAYDRGIRLWHASHAARGRSAGRAIGAVHEFRKSW